MEVEALLMRIINELSIQFIGPCMTRKNGQMQVRITVEHIKAFQQFDDIFMDVQKFGFRAYGDACEFAVIIAKIVANMFGPGIIIKSSEWDETIRYMCKFVSLELTNNRTFTVDSFIFELLDFIE